MSEAEKLVRAQLKSDVQNIAAQMMKINASYATVTDLLCVFGIVAETTMSALAMTKELLDIEEAQEKLHAPNMKEGKA